MARVEAFVIVAALVVAGGVLMQTVSTPSTAPSTMEPPRLAAPPAPAEPEGVVAETAPMPKVSGVPDAVGTVLAASGHAEFVGVDELLVDLPPSVVAVLIDADVTLRVAETSP